LRTGSGRAIKTGSTVAHYKQQEKEEARRKASTTGHFLLIAFETLSLR
jgi:hypothetical protein